MVCRGRRLTHEVLLVHFATDSELLDLRQELCHDAVVMIRHVSLQRVDVLKLDDQLVVPLCLADKSCRARAALNLRSLVEHVVEHEIKLVGGSVIFNL